MRCGLFHRLPPIERGLVMIPVGLYYNREAQELKGGDTIVFFDGEEREVISVVYMNLKTSTAGLICEYIYHATLKRVFKQWEINIIIEGGVPQAISREKCLLIRYREKDGKNDKVDSTDNLPKEKED